MSFDVDMGWASSAGPRERNEDFAAAMWSPAWDGSPGLVAAIADGVSTGGRGTEAAQTAVISIVEDFHAAPATWEPTVVFDRLIGAHNGWLFDHNHRRSGPGGGGGAGLTTLTAVALQGQMFTVAHVGDTRAWLLRDGECRLLTQDHALDHPDLRSQLTRVVGLDVAITVDYLQGELQVGDRLVLTTDGVHGVLKVADIERLGGQATAQAASQALVDAALAAGGHDNATALVLVVRGLAPMRHEDAALPSRTLPVPARLKVGDVLDGFTITACVADTGVHLLYQARDNATRDLVALKTLHPSRASDPEERAMLAHEAWLGMQVTERGAQGFVRAHPVKGASAFYQVYDWHAGQTLEQWMGADRDFTITEVVQAGIAWCRALGRLHRLGVIHRDIKPGNLYLGEDGLWRILDLGVAVSGREPSSVRSLHAGTPSYMNPEQWRGDDGEAASAASDLYALGVTLYQWLTKRLPYGEIEPWQTGRFRRDPIAPSRVRPEVPIWLDHVILKAVARDEKLRFETAEEFMLALERGAARPLAAPGSTPLVRRDPAALWKAGFAVSLAFNLLLMVWLLFLPR